MRTLRPKGAAKPSKKRAKDPVSPARLRLAKKTQAEAPSLPDARDIRMGERIVARMANLGLDAEDLVKALDCDLAYVQKIASNRRPITALIGPNSRSELNLLADVLGVMPRWLETGEGPMTIETMGPEAKSTLRAEPLAGELEHDLFEAISQVLRDHGLTYRSSGVQLQGTVTYAGSLLSLSLHIVAAPVPPCL